MRERFRCVKCGLRLEGREIRGVVYAYDRAPADVRAPEKIILCVECAEREDALDAIDRLAGPPSVVTGWQYEPATDADAALAILREKARKENAK